MSSEPPAETIYDAIARDEVRKSLDGVPTDQEYADQRTRRKNSTDFARQPVALTDE